MQNKKCLKCGKCCRFRSNNEEYSVVIFPSDLLRISERLKITKAKFVQEYCDKHTLDVGEDLVELYMLKAVNRACIFLTDDNLCKIYNDRPVQCQKAPYDFFSNSSLWEDIPCIDSEHLASSNSYISDKQIVSELLEGYNLFD